MSAYLARFADTICDADETAIRSDLTVGGKLVLESVGDLTVSYAPFEHLAHGAKIVIVGITPTPQQVRNALFAVRRHLLQNAGYGSALAAAHVYAACSGQTQKNLVRMLDHIGVARWLGVGSTSWLWTTHRALAHFTSALRFPVFVAGKYYCQQGDMSRSPPLARLLNTCLAEEAMVFSDAVWIPAGPRADQGVQHLVREGLLRADQVLSGLVNPNQANNERVYYFAGLKARETLSSITEPVRIDIARDALIAQVSKLPAATLG
ncbi:MAG: hypothetical protein JOY70_04280 [Acidisphaera sp.]|nr:hypothetical protein [Acidisphaera sp.]